MLPIVVFLLSAALLAYEVALMRLLAITQWSHSAYLVISIALLGFGASGTVVTLGGAWLRRRETQAVAVLAACFGAAMPLCFQWAQALDLNVLELPWQARQVWLLAAVALILMIPFMLGAGAIALAISSAPERSQSLYAANLVGSGAGAWGIVGLLWALDAILALLVLFVAAMAAALLAAYRVRGWRARLVLRVVWLGSAAAVFALLVRPTGLALRINQFKALPGLLTLPEARIVAHATTPLARLDVVTARGLHVAPPVGYRVPGGLPVHVVLLTDADAPSPVYFWEERDELRFADYTTSALPYHLRERAGGPRSVCVIGAGGGTDVDLAYYHRCAPIHAVELNPRVFDVLRQVRPDSASPYNARIGDRLHLAVAEGRGYLERTRHRFDVIQISLIDSFSAASAGVYALNESYLYTVEALRTYLGRLTPDGMLAITRWLKPARELAAPAENGPAPAADPHPPLPRDVIKLFATAVEALEDRGARPAEHLILIRSHQTATLLAANRPFDGADVDHLRAFCRDRHFDLVHFPGIQAPDAQERYHQFDPEPIYYRAAQKVLSEDRDAFIAGYFYDISPATDDRPFFFHFFRPQTLPTLLRALGRPGAPPVNEVEWAYMSVLATLAVATGLSLLLIVAPLAMVRWKRPAGTNEGRAVKSAAAPLPLYRRPPAGRSRSPAGFRRYTGGRTATAIYCIALGLGFMFIEIAFIQKFILFLSYPLYAISVIIAGLLVLAGVGSWLAGRLRWSPGRLIPLAVAVIVAVSVLYALALNPLLRLLMTWPDWARIAMTFVLLIPLGVPMGMPFPTALRRLGRALPSLVPWAWAINGCASVTAASLATALAVSFGFRAVVVLAALLYLLAGLLFPRLPHRTA